MILFYPKGNIIDSFNPECKTMMYAYKALKSKNFKDPVILTNFRRKIEKSRNNPFIN